MLLESPGFSAVALLSTALGIGANTTVFCWTQTVVLRPLSIVSQATRLVLLTMTFADSTWAETVWLPALKDHARLTDVLPESSAPRSHPDYFAYRPRWFVFESQRTWKERNISSTAGATFAPRTATRAISRDRGSQRIQAARDRG